MATEIKEESLPYVYIDIGDDMEFNDFNVPGVVATDLSLSDLSHIETTDDTVKLIINEAGKQRCISFTNDSFSKFKVMLNDQTELDLNMLDEHIVLE